MQRDILEVSVNLRRKLLASLFAALFLLCIFSSNQDAFANGDTQTLVETGWLADSLKNPDIRAIYVGSPSPKSMANFGGSHIPGSAYVSIGSLMGVLGNGSAPPDKAGFEALMNKLGISNASHVVVYGDESGNPFIASAFWLLEYFGHEKVSYLNGGINKWRREKRPTEAGAPAKANPANYKAVPDASVLANSDYVLKGLKKPVISIVDVRGSDAYKGLQNELPDHNKRTGHIPGAVNIDFYSTNLNSDGTFKSANELKAAYESKGVTGDKEVITYCQSGVRAAHTYIALKHILGYRNVRNYVGSWGEWGNLDPSKYSIEK